MKKIVLTITFIALVSTVSFAQWGDLINKVKANPLVVQAQQGGFQDIIKKAQAISSAFSQMPANSGKLEFIKAALPILLQAQTNSSNVLAEVQQGKPVDQAQTTTMNGLLDQVKGLIAQKWSSNPLIPTQLPDMTAQTQKFGGVISSILGNEGTALKSMLQAPTAH